MDIAPRISFGIIVFNGEPFTRYCLRALYPFAHEIIIVEGGHEGTRAVATHDGHSTDGTLTAIAAFMEHEDPENKVRLVTRDGFWPMTDELGRHRTAQSRAYAELATGDYLWQVDIDEFYLPEDMARVIDLLRRHPDITRITFPYIDFWARPTYRIGSSRLLRKNEAHRLFKWGPGYKYVTHQPPTVHDDQGRDLATLMPVNARTAARLGFTMYHYSHLLPSQVNVKAHVYKGQYPGRVDDMLDWYEQSYRTLRRPYRMERRYHWPSWLERYEGPQPPEVRRLMSDIAEGRLDWELRPVEDAERLLDSRWYPLGAQALRAAEPLRQAWRIGRPPLANLLRGRLPRSLRKDVPSASSPAPRVGEAATGEASDPGGRVATSPVQPRRTGPSVVFLAPFFEVPHGMAATNRLLLLARALSHAGARPQILSIQPSGRAAKPGNVVADGVASGVPFHYVAGSPVKDASFAGRRRDELRGWATTLIKLSLLRRRGRLDAVYVWPRKMRWTWSRPLLLTLPKLVRAPVILESNERPWSVLPDPRRMERLVSPLRGVDGVVCISEYLAAWTREEAARRHLNTQVLEVPILVDCDEFPVAPYPEGPPLLVFAASPAYRTTAEFILDAMELVWPTHPGCRLVVTGVDMSSERGAWLAERRATGRLDDRVEVPGRVSRADLLAYYAAAHALLVPLFDDVQSAARFPTKIGEYLAARRPVITTPVGEIPRYFTDRENAFVADDCSVDAYAAAIDEVLADPVLAGRVGDAGRALCERTFDYRIHGKALAGFVAELAKGPERLRTSEEVNAT